MIELEEVNSRSQDKTLSATLRTDCSSLPSLGLSGILRFNLPGGRDVYNITAPFNFGGRRLIAGRVEPRDSELSDIQFFEEVDADVWSPAEDIPMLSGLQDPCVTIWGDEVILGGVEYPVMAPDQTLGWRMRFFRGQSLQRLRSFLDGPVMMKDIRLLVLHSGEVAVLTRPQGIVGGRGRIGFFLAESLESITAARIEQAPLLPQRIPPGEWVGGNEMHFLGGRMIGVLGHIAYFDGQDNRHYLAMSFTFDIDTLEPSPIRVIARRRDFPEGPTKRPDLEDVIFSGGLVRNGNGRSVLYAGLSDAAAGYVDIPDPFGPA
jgi:hypothetical protein